MFKSKEEIKEIKEELNAIWYSIREMEKDKYDFLHYYSMLFRAIEEQGNIKALGEVEVGERFIYGKEEYIKGKSECWNLDDNKSFNISDEEKVIIKSAFHK